MAMPRFLLMHATRELHPIKSINGGARLSLTFITISRFLKFVTVSSDTGARKDEIADSRKATKIHVIMIISDSCR